MNLSHLAIRTGLEGHGKIATETQTTMAVSRTRPLPVLQVTFQQIPVLRKFAKLWRSKATARNWQPFSSDTPCGTRKASQPIRWHTVPMPNRIYGHVVDGAVPIHWPIRRTMTRHGDRWPPILNRICKEAISYRGTLLLCRTSYISCDVVRIMC